jgi:hypothetical protein
MPEVNLRTKLKATTIPKEAIKIGNTLQARKEVICKGKAKEMRNAGEG